jgi:hypothetical protein
MNLSGPQRLALRYGKRGAGAARVFRSRPIYCDAAVAPTRRSASLSGELAWSASVCDELLAASDGTLTRRIRILITDGPKLSPPRIARSA